jgi:hypothetical protein
MSTVEILSITDEDGFPVPPIQIPTPGPPGPDGWAVPIQNITETTGTAVIDYSAGKYAKVTLDANTTLSVINWPPAGEFARLTLRIIQGGSFSLGWPTGIKWSFDIPAITQGTGSIDMYAITTDDGGATLLGHVIGQNFE